MKVLIIPSHNYPLEIDNYKGGIENFTVETWKAFNKFGHDAFLLCSNCSPIRSQLKTRCWDYPCKNTFADIHPNKRYSLKNAWPEIIGWIEEMKFDAIISSVSSIPLQRDLVEAVDCPVLYFMHRMMVYRNDFDFCESMAELRDQNKNMRIIAVSDFLKRGLNKKVPGCVDGVVHLNYCMPEEDPYVYQGTLESSVVYVGRIVKEKSIESLISWFKDSDIRLDLIGDSPNKTKSEKDWFRECIQYVAEDNLNINYHEGMKRKELFRFIKSFHCLISPNPGETFSLSTFEAQKLGVPVVCVVKNSPEGPEEYVLNGTTGYVVNTYRKRNKDIGVMVREAVENCQLLKRSTIRNHFETYSDEKYLHDLRVQILFGTQRILGEQL